MREKPINTSACEFGSGLKPQRLSHSYLLRPSTGEETLQRHGVEPTHCGFRRNTALSLQTQLSV